jgi:hypothetical protein
MKKLVPDPPSLDITETTTARTPFGTNRMFTVCAGIPAEEALIHACHLLACATATLERSQAVGAAKHVAAAQALIAAVLEGAEVRRKLALH